MNPLKQLEQYGQSFWIDYIRRGLLDSGGLAKLVRGDGLKGLSSNPAIFEKAISEGAEYVSAGAARRCLVCSERSRDPASTVREGVCAS